MHGAGNDMVSSMNGVWAALLLDADRSIEVAPALEIVEKIALALVQQVIVKSIFLIDGHMPFQNTMADAESLGGNQDDRSGLDQIGVIDGIGFRVVLLFCNRYLRQHALLLLKLLPQVLKRIGDTYGGNPLAGVHPGDILQLFLGES